MKIPNRFKEKIKSVFYDKTLKKYTVSEGVDSEGWGFVSENNNGLEFVGNVQFAKLEEIQKGYGVEYPIDITITTDERVENGEIVEYEGNKYKIVMSIRNDTHYLLLGKKWKSKYYGLTSA